jgi:radical SAM superfamily enzyme
MPLDKPELFGTNADGTKSEEYCTYCFQNGKPTEPNITMEEMIDKCVKIMVQRKIMLERQARGLMTNTIPCLKRWKK